jgi:hypothetical protein
MSRLKPNTHNLNNEEINEAIRQQLKLLVREVLVQDYEFDKLSEDEKRMIYNTLHKEISDFYQSKKKFSKNKKMIYSTNFSLEQAFSLSTYTKESLKSDKVNEVFKAIIEEGGHLHNGKEYFKANSIRRVVLIQKKFSKDIKEIMDAARKKTNSKTEIMKLRVNLYTKSNLRAEDYGCKEDTLSNFEKNRNKFITDIQKDMIFLRKTSYNQKQLRIKKIYEQENFVPKTIMEKYFYTKDDKLIEKIIKYDAEKRKFKITCDEDDLQDKIIAGKKVKVCPRFEHTHDKFKDKENKMRKVRQKRVISLSCDYKEGESDEKRNRCVYNDDWTKAGKDKCSINERTSRCKQKKYNRKAKRKDEKKSEN